MRALFHVIFSCRLGICFEAIEVLTINAERIPDVVEWAEHCQASKGLGRDDNGGQWIKARVLEAAHDLVLEQVVEVAAAINRAGGKVVHFLVDEYACDLIIVVEEVPRLL